MWRGGWPAVERSARHTIVFTATLCLVFSLLVSSVSVALRDRQEENRRLGRIKNVLAVAGLLQPAERPSRAEIQARFEANVVPRVVDLASGRTLDDVDALAFDPRRAARDPELSRPAPENAAKVRRVPHRALIFHLVEDDRVTGLILPVEGYGLWSTLYGYLALEADARTIRGLTFYEHGETAGLGGEVDNPRWKALWPGRLAFDDVWQPAVRVVKGRAGPVSEDPFRVDGISGATLTANGVTHLLHFWLGEQGFATYLAEYRRALDDLEAG
jgi:Na+-transporting NADH:ubiquinone oxidoreductase subunit C